MTFSKDRATLSGLAASAASLMLLVPTITDARPTVRKPAEDLPEIYASANGALMRGDAKSWSTLLPLSDDFVLMSPFGGKPSRYTDYTPEKIERMGRFFQNGRHQQDIVEVYASKDIVVLAAIERDQVEVGGLPAQQWALRVTSVFKREGSRWKLAHRHADPLVDDIAFEEAARLARGVRASARECSSRPGR